MSEVLALIPARSGSKGIPNKNFRPLAGGQSPVERALVCAEDAEALSGANWGDWDIICSTDMAVGEADGRWLWRPPALAQDDTPMIEVAKHALEQIPGPDDQIVLLIQPTQPLRQPKHLIAAIELLRASEADSVVSVVAVPSIHHPLNLLEIVDGALVGFGDHFEWLGELPARRQDLDDEPAYVRDGTVYAFWRRTVDTHDDIYGAHSVPLIIPPEETCPLDTPDDWAEAERRLRNQ